jgi:hypothetical protein
MRNIDSTEISSGKGRFNILLTPEAALQGVSVKSYWYIFNFAGLLQIQIQESNSI